MGCSTGQVQNEIINEKSDKVHSQQVHGQQDDKQMTPVSEECTQPKLNLTKKPTKKELHHKLYLNTSNAALGSYNLQAPPQGITILDRSQFDKLQSAILTKKFLKEHQNVIVKGIFENDGTRADFLDMYNLMLDGAAGFILETQELRVVEGAIETVLVFENEKI
ncbi:Conserved_hypothetical protein [Hexamita inflata]|uniref:Uncharacterized protein n=1 Tax=Hexamita inflata TaxID=28002 RepID=A0ABP1HI89_9EUKA